MFHQTHKTPAEFANCAPSVLTLQSILRLLSGCLRVHKNLMKNLNYTILDSAKKI